jgi:ribonuclease E
MANKMLIDATHPEETRVVVVRGSKVEDFDFEAANRRPLRGNIYLAKVTRVEPSLQAAFVEYGGNRHGFLPFSEIHPDYYQIPVADRQALLEEEARAASDEEREEEPRRRRRRGGMARRRRGDEVVRSGAAEGDAPAPEFAGDETGETPVSENAAGDASAVSEASANEALAAEDFTTSRAMDPTEHGTASAAAPEGDGAPEGGASALDAGPSDSEDAVPSASDSVAFDTTARTTEAEPPQDAPLAEATAAAEDRPESTGEDESHAPGEDASEAAAVEARRDAEPNGDQEDEDDGDQEDEEDIVEQVGGDALEEAHERRRPMRRQYKIQEVIKRRQILLVQVVKEERGTKGAALTTYLSLAGRYSVLMPNTGKGGGISRKITSAEDRKRLKEIAQELEVPEGMGVILRTAGASRTKSEIKRDFEYLMRLWESVRETTLTSSAPALVYEEGSLIKRSIRDLYNKDIDEILVAGEDAYREARDFMRTLMPSHTKAVRLYKDPQPLFACYGVEAQLDAMFSNHVSLRSGGYLVINPTEALVSIDVNSGRATREHNIEDTALKTNLEASEEIARQLRLRDLAGLIVIDFIDMEERRNDRSVEKKLKDCLKNDRARIQVGRISPFGLLEMSRQRIRTGVLESSSVPCPHCAGTGSLRSTPSIALHILRSLEEMLIRSASHNLSVRTRLEVALYILNQKRVHLRELEGRFGVTVAIGIDENLPGASNFAIDRAEPALRLEPRTAPAGPATGIQVDSVLPVDEPIEVEPTELAGEDVPATAHDDEAAGEAGGRRRRRRRRRRGRGGEGREGAFQAGSISDEGDAEDDESEDEASDEGEPEFEPQTQPAFAIEAASQQAASSSDASSASSDGPEAAQPSPPRREVALANGPEPEAAEVNGVHGEADAAQPAADRPDASRQEETEPVAVVLTPPDPNRPKRAGWWSKAKAAITGS